MNFGPFQTLEVPFDKDANITPLGPIDGSGAQAALVALAPAIDDLIVISHGWNNDVDDARTLYAAIFASVANAWSTAGLTPADQAKTAILALYWPSKRFDESDLIPGGAAAVQDPVAVDYGAKIAAQIANLKDAFGQFGPAQQALLDRALAQVPLLDTEAGQNAYVAALAALFPATTGEADPDSIRARAAWPSVAAPMSWPTSKHNSGSRLPPRQRPAAPNRSATTRPR